MRGSRGGRRTRRRRLALGSLVVALWLGLASGSSARAQAPPTTGWRGVVKVVEHHVSPVTGSDATTSPYPLGVSTGSSTYEATFNGVLDANGNTTGTATATFEESWDHDGYFCFPNTRHIDGSGKGPVVLTGDPSSDYPLFATALTIPLHSVSTGPGATGCSTDTTSEQPVGGADQLHPISPEVIPETVLGTVRGTRTYADPPSVQDLTQPNGNGDGTFTSKPFTFTNSVTITWRLTRSPVRRLLGNPVPKANKGPGPVARPTKERSSVVAAIPTVKDVSKNGRVIITNLILVAVLMLLVVFPSQLFNSTLKEHYDEVRGWFRLPWNRGKPLAPPRAPFDVPRSKRVALYMAFVAAAAVLHGFLDPKFGFDAASATLLAGLVIGIPIVTLVSSVGTLAYTKVKHQDRAVMRVFPGTLFVAAGCVLISRLAHFAPGYMYGVIAGFVFSRQLSAKDEGRRQTATVAWVLVASLAAWVVLSALQTHVLHGFVGFWWEILLSALTTVFLGGIQGMALGLVPMRTLPGEKVFGWSKAVWAVLFGFTLFLFVHLLLHPQSGFGSADHPTPLFTWLGLFIGFGLLSVLFWAYFRFRSPRPATEGGRPPGEGDIDVDVTVDV